MRKWMRGLAQLALVGALAFGAYAIFVPGAAIAGKGGGGGNGKGGGNQPPACGCAEVIVLPDGTVCTLDACGSDCVYSCPLPF